MNKKLKEAIQQFSQELTDDLLKDDEFSRGYKDALKDLMELIDKNECDSDNGYQETTNPNENIRQSVLDFAIAMEKKLRENDHKPGWDLDSNEQLLSKMLMESRELSQCIFLNRDNTYVANEAVDVANFAMMLFDNNSGL